MSLLKMAFLPLKWATFFFLQTSRSQQTLVCLLGQFEQRFS
jgi:hypothetical protein